MKIIDPHVHLFDLQQGEYHWLKNENPPFWPQKFRIQRTYSSTDLNLSDGLQLAAFVHIEAGFNNAEGHLEFAMLAEQNHKPMKAIGFIDITLAHDEFLVALKLQSDYAIAAGIRYIFESDVRALRNILENENAFNNLSFLAERNGIFELQCDVKNTEVVVLIYAFFSRIPTLSVVINHAGFAPLPRVAGATNDATYQLDYTNWKANMLLLSQLPKVAVKFSGFEMQQLFDSAASSAEESQANLHLLSNSSYPVSDLQDSLLHCLKAFGEENVMLASNFPLCTFTHNYQQYWQQMLALLTSLPDDRLSDHNALVYDNAKRIYGFNALS
ncbi:amidohydrolase family protein [Glaciecola sp. MH2013]|uniref:amidohydrolase family protein n=1 Tax=Glaciecola sp. MH2013 TaxID=2785524 RepID=UPI0018A0FD09|nr:amidohydrolase family protein [Glaciecola sp. MH2013]MBF7073449.1 amidohydrolase family protein [Glaciecola sp. MH2013]